MQNQVSILSMTFNDDFLVSFLCWNSTLFAVDMYKIYWKSRMLQYYNIYDSC